MEPIRCHICNEPLIRIKTPRKETFWECTAYALSSNGSFEVATHCLIQTNPKRHGIVLSYYVPLHHNGRSYLLESKREPPQTNLTHEYVDKGYTTYSVSPIIKRFYPIKLKEPLAPQFIKIFENVKLCLTFL